MLFDSCSFNIGENTLMEIDQQINYVKTPLTSKHEEEEIVEESPNGKENTSLCQLSLHERLKNASQRNRLKLEKLKSNSTIGKRDQTVKQSELTSVSKYLHVEEIDMSAWEKSAAKLMSPPAFASKAEEDLTDYNNLHLNFTESQEENDKISQDLFTDDQLDQAIFGDFALSSSTNIEDLEISHYDLDNVTFIQPNNNDQRQIEFEMIQQKSILITSETFLNESVLRPANLSTREQHMNHSLKLETSENLRFISSWNLPLSVVNEYRKKNVTEMFEWQCECLKNPKVLFEGSNLVYSAPTSAGKTLVSEILMIKNVVERKKKALFILPFVSVVREKMFYLQDLTASSGMRVEGFFGGYHPPGGFESIDLAVVTIEKANSIVNRLLEQNRLDDIGVIVIDEIHLISDSSRGYILELLITKILFMCEKFQYKIQLVTMSATLPNVDLLCKWLKAEYFFTDYRPIELREMIKIGKKIHDHNLNFIKIIDEKFKEFFPNDTDEICLLAMETIVENCQLIIFCPSKEWCEKLCLNLARGIYSMRKKKVEAIKGIFDEKRLANLLEQMKALPSGCDQELQKSLAYGCAFHHAGLTTDERDVIEMGFKDGTLKVLVATSTLSSGVNLPARRVIIRTPMFGKKVMSNLTYRQMIGRAGRKGKDILGESILVCSETTAKAGKLLVETPLDPISSCLDIDGHAHFKRALLEIMAAGVANTSSDLQHFISSTLFCQQNDIDFNYFEDISEEKINMKLKNKDVSDPITLSMNFLLEYEFIRLHRENESKELQFVPTRLALACLSSSLPPKDGFLLFSELQKSRQNFVLESELHAIYLVTPFSVAYQLQEIDWIHFAEIHDKLPETMKRVGEMVGISATYLIKAITGRQGSDWRAHQIHKRFYTSLALQELVNEKSISSVSEKFKIPRGLLQNLQQTASTFSAIVTTFCKSLQWNLLALILAQFRERLFFGIHPDLIELMKIPSMSSTRIARALHKSGIEKLTDLANCTTLSVENVLIDLGENFFVVGKSMELSVQEVARLMINDARSSIQNEMGLKEVKWNKEEDQQKIAKNFQETSEANQTTLRKRKVETLLNSSDFASEETPGKKKKIDLDLSLVYRKKLRSSGGAQDVICINTQFMNDLDKKAENEKSVMEKTNENASMFINPEPDDESSSLLELTQEHLQIVDVLADKKIFELFKKEISEQKEISMSVGVQKFQSESQIIGGNLLKSNRTQNDNKRIFIFDGNFYIDCISFCYIGNRVCCLNFQKKDILLINNVKRFLKELMNRTDLTLKIYEAREHLKVLQKAIGLGQHINVKIRDPRMASWMIDPDTNFSWHQMVQKFSPGHLSILELASKHSCVSSLGLSHVSRVEPKIRVAVECFLTNILTNQQLEIMKTTGKGLLARVFCDLEMSIQVVLMKMETSGFPISEIKLQQTIENASLLQRKLEHHIYELNGRNFNLTSSKEVSKVVGIHQNLQKKKVSTAKNVLEKLDLPIANCIMSWRTLTKTIANIQPMTKLVRNERIFANSFSLTQTGRISMYEPNLQNVTKDFLVEFKGLDGSVTKQIVSFRRVFQCQTGRVLLSADFCQLELRILTHLSKDPNLLKVMNSPGEDIFKKIAAKWNNIDEADVNPSQRNQTKQLCYGIIYGMGNKVLADTMKVDEETSAKLAAEFHATYPGIKMYGEKVVQKTRDQGFIETVTCRRRYLPAIRSDNSSDRNQAERQALNTCIQGSASDLVKNAILRMDRNIHKQNFDGCNLVLHLHDELFYEVPKTKLKDVAKILIHSMQNCVKLTVPLMVKLKYGDNWGEMKQFDP